MKIALLSEHASPLAAAGSVDSGGQNVYVANVARQLARAGHQVDVFTRRDKALLPMISRMGGSIRVIHIPAGPARSLSKELLLPYMDAFGNWLLDFFRGETRPYDVVHANFFMSGLAGLKAKDLLHIPLVTTFHALGRVRRQHQGEADGFPNQRFDIEDELCRRSDLLIAECPQDRDDLIRFYNAAPARIEIVPCGFDADEFAPLDRREARATLDWAADEFIVLQLGRLVPRKGIDNVIRGIARLKAQHGVQARLYIVGGNSEAPNELATPEIARLRAVASEGGVAGQVSFVGRRGRPQLKHFYSAADVFVTTPWYEPFGITPIEAMACGTPVIGSRVGGVQYTVQDGATGYLVPPNDPDALADRLARLAADPALTRRLGEAGRARANTHFTWAGVGYQLLAAYARVAPAKAPARASATLGDHEDDFEQAFA